MQLLDYFILLFLLHTIRSFFICYYFFVLFLFLVVVFNKEYSIFIINYLSSILNCIVNSKIKWCTIKYFFLPTSIIYINSLTSHENHFRSANSQT